MRVPLTYPIGRRGQPWNAEEKVLWLSSRTRRRSYLDDVVSKLRTDISTYSFSEHFHVVEYGSVLGSFATGCGCGRSSAVLSNDDGVVASPTTTTTTNTNTFAAPLLPLFAVVPRRWDETRPSVLITGGVHGYETSGVRGALRFLLSGRAREYASSSFNVVVVPCVSPWSYEMEERWNCDAIDPNRSFVRQNASDGGGGDGGGSSKLCKEAMALMDFLDGLPPCDGVEEENGTTGECAREVAEEQESVLSSRAPRWLCHIDLHETTDSDRTEFRPARSARDGLVDYETRIPDGFYLVGDSDNYKAEWYESILAAVGKVTHIAPRDSDDGTICGYESTGDGIISVPCQSLGICGGGAVDAEYVTTTEVYPDSDRTDEEECVMAQVTAICAALDYISEEEKREK